MDDFNVDFKTTPSPVGEARKNFDSLNTGFTDFLGSQESVPQLINRYDDRFGVPNLQSAYQSGMEQYDALGNQIRGVKRDVQQGSRESILNQGQLNRMTSAQQAPLLEQQGILGSNISRIGERLSSAEGNAARMVEAEQAQQLKMTQPWMQRYSTEETLSAMAMTGWSTQNSLELQTLLANQQAGITLSEGEKNRMNELAIKEKEFKNNLDKLKQNPMLISSGSMGIYQNGEIFTGDWI